eukprot:g5137.t1
MFIEAGILLSVLVGVGVRRRFASTRTEQTQTPSSPTVHAKESPSSSWSPVIWSSLLILSAVLIYWFYPGNLSLLSPRGESSCTPIDVHKRVELWNYDLSTIELRNVSENAITQKLFNQGMIMRWGFALFPSQKTFEEAIEYDRNCAMCYWALAYARSPFANVVGFASSPGFPYYSIKDNQAAREWLQIAQGLPHRSPKETQYIKIMQGRFPKMEDMKKEVQEWIEFLYGAKMLMVWKSDSADLDAGILAIEAFINCIPWDYYLSPTTLEETFDIHITWEQLVKSTFPDDQQEKIEEFRHETRILPSSQILDAFPLQEKTHDDKIEETPMRDLARVTEHLLLRIMELDPNHPLALHLHIHLTESSSGSDPAKGLPSANRLAMASRNWKSPHLVHMPSHTYARVGHYWKVIEANEAAHEMDLELSDQCIQPYLPEHNIRLLVFGANMGGFLSKAETWARTLRKLPEKIVSSMYMSRGREYVGLLHVWGRFGKWNEILTLDPPSSDARGDLRKGGYPFAKSMFHYYRFLAFSHLEASSTHNRRLLEHPRSQSETEFLAFKESMEEVEKKPPTLPGVGLGIYAAAKAMVRGDFNLAIDQVEHLQDWADGMGYIEPPLTPQPPSQCHGYLLLAAGRLQEAKGVYEGDLEANPNNPWSTLGLAQVYKAMKLKKEADNTMEKYKSMKSAELTSSCPILELS